MAQNNFPKHIAIIMDGNGRWAKSKGLPRAEGHRQGIKNVKSIVKAARQLGIKVLTLFAFSTENWNRPKKEIDMLMSAMERFLKQEIKDLHKNNIKFRITGRLDHLVPESLKETIKKAEELTKNNSGLVVNLAFNYGSRLEIVDAAKKIAEAVVKNKINIDQIDEDVFSSFLYTEGLPDPDILIRTSGEERISNFLLWQLSYSELYFTKKFWPEFGVADFKGAIEEFQRRERRFGKVK